ncbi:MAG: penicillin acylase family protein, partial [Flavobacteriaceae bacterium]|nr:penicillin acylase family protein [Flavobacteriaceae bacterium]
MKYFKLILSAVVVTAIFYLLNTKIGSIPPLGKFLNPATGFWQNETSEISNETLDIPGLSQPVEVFYDQHNIPHIFAQNQEDLAMAQGYVTAKDRLWQMEFQTHAAAGRISEIIGEAALNYDRGQRRKGMVYGAEMAMKAMEDDAEIVRLLDAFTSGINHYISKLEPEDYPIEYKLLDYQPEHWERIKVGLLLMYMTDMLTGGDSDFEYTNFINKYGKERFDFLYPDFFEVNDPVIPADKKWDDLNAQMTETPLSEVPKDTLQKAMEDANPDNGSNNWAISPKLSYSGNAILANDPHLGLNLPSIWYVMQLHTPEFNVMGATLPGVYGVISGFNNNIAWGVTNATRDVRDWYKIEFRDKNKEEYRYADEWRPTTKRVETIKIRNKEAVIDTVVYTHHGPVSYDDNFNLNKEKVGYALQWIGHLGGNVQRTFVELNRSKNYEDYVEALKYYHAPAQNFVFASTEGDIALWVQGKFPNKWKGQGKFLLDGSKPEHDWQGYIPQEHNAFIKNPERGFVSSANQHPVDPSYPYYVFNDGYETYRNRVINDFFRSKDKFNIQDFKALHNNNYNLKAAELLPYLIENITEEELTESEKQTFNIVKKWNYYNEVDSKGASIWEAWSNQL